MIIVSVMFISVTRMLRERLIVIHELVHLGHLQADSVSKICINIFQVIMKPYSKMRMTTYVSDHSAYEVM
jgi:beta-lactamase regulating signal transducer with metallopeptidase domain